MRFRSAGGSTLDGRIEVDLAPREIFTHGAPKCTLITRLFETERQEDSGYLFMDARVACPRVNLSVAPDIVFVLYDAVDSGRTAFVPAPGGDPESRVEVEGAPDIVVEIVADSSFMKDTKRLPPLYFTAGVQELWLIDARKELLFSIQVRGSRGFHPIGVDGDGCQLSHVLQRRFRLHRKHDRYGHWKYALDVLPMT